MNKWWNITWPEAIALVGVIAGCIYMFGLLKEASERTREIRTLMTECESKGGRLENLNDKLVCRKLSDEFITLESQNDI